MRSVFLNKDKFGLRYRTENGSAWSYLPDRCQNTEEVLKLFTQNGRYEEPMLIFTDDRGERVNYYNIKNNVAIVNFDKKYSLQLPVEAFLPYQEQIEYLQQFSDRALDSDVLKLPSDFQKLQLLKQNASEGELNNLKEMIKERMTSENIEKFCQEHSQKFYQNKAVVIFEK